MPTAGFSQPDASIGLSVSGHPQSAHGRTFLVNSVASGGTHYSVVVRVA